MPGEKSRSQEFLDEFTKEMIMHLKADLDAKERERRELERIKREIEIQKLKEKFSKEEVGKMQPGTPAIIKREPEPKVQPVHMVRLPIPKPIQTIAKPKPPMAKIEAPKVLPPVAPGEIDFGKISFLIRDPLITYIECPGPAKNIVIRKAGNTFTTQIILVKEEIVGIIKSFSEVTRIPLVEGMLTARYKNIEISAVISETMAPSFIIRKDIIPSIQKPTTQFLSPTEPYRPMAKPLPAPKPLNVPVPAPRPILPVIQAPTPVLTTKPMQATPQQQVTQAIKPIPAPALRPIPQGTPVRMLAQQARPMPYPPAQQGIQQKPEEKKESIFSKKIKFGK